MAKCSSDCDCGRHVGSWTGKTRPDMQGRAMALRHGHTWKGEDGRACVSLTYKSWQAMRNRCRPGKPYAIRGIVVCERWNRFDEFLEDMGERPSADYSIDRIDNDGNYELGNCRWATRSEQQYNRRPYSDWSAHRG